MSVSKALNGFWLLPLFVACTSVSSISTIPVGDSRCPNGGIEVKSGKSTQIICNPGSKVVETDLPVGDANCPNGGVKLQTGTEEPDGGIDVTSTQYICTNDGTDVGSFVIPSGPAGSFSINASGGSSSGGPGGEGGGVTAGMEYGSNGGHVKVFATGSVDLSIALPSPLPTPDLGDNPWKPTANAEVTYQASMMPSGLASGDAFTTGDTYLYIWDGAAAKPATGVSIPAGVTVTFDVGGGEMGVSVSLAGDFVNGGKLTTEVLADGVSAADLSINAFTFEGLPGSSIALAGAAGMGGGNGGNGGTLAIEAMTMSFGGRFYNAGSIDVSGGAGAVGGGGGGVELTGGLGLINTGSINGNGGTGQTGGGGAGGSVQFGTEADTIQNSGNITINGGVGATTGGAGGGVEMMPSQFGGVQNSGNISANGGDAAASCSTGCQGGAGGGAQIEAIGEDATNSGSFSVAGGAGGAGQGGSGGGVTVVTGPLMSPGIEVSGGTIRISGSIDVHGGSGATGGGSGGGAEIIQAAAANAPQGQEVILMGYGQGFQANGGSGTTGGSAGGFEFINQAGVIEDSMTMTAAPVVGGSVINTVNLTAQGGAGSSGAGGNGGEAQLHTQGTINFPDQIEWVINSGNISLAGGAGGSAGGDCGAVEFMSRSGVMSSGNVTMDGGAATASSGTAGGSSSQGEILAGSGPVSNTGNFSMNGGSATASGGAGGQGQSLAMAGTTVTNSGNFSSNGGNGALTGGNGGLIELVSLNGTTKNTGTGSAKGGTGATAGENGAMSVDGVDVSSN